MKREGYMKDYTPKEILLAWTGSLNVLNISGIYSTSKKITRIFQIMGLILVNCLVK